MRQHTSLKDFVPLERQELSGGGGSAERRSRPATSEHVDRRSLLERSLACSAQEHTRHCLLLGTSGPLRGELPRRRAAHRRQVRTQHTVRGLEMHKKQRASSGGSHWCVPVCRWRDVCARPNSSDAPRARQHRHAQACQCIRAQRHGHPERSAAASSAQRQHQGRQRHGERSPRHLAQRRVYAAGGQACPLGARPAAAAPCHWSCWARCSPGRARKQPGRGHRGSQQAHQRQPARWRACRGRRRSAAACGRRRRGSGVGQEARAAREDRARRGAGSTSGGGGSCPGRCPAGPRGEPPRCHAAQPITWRRASVAVGISLRSCPRSCCPTRWSTSGPGRTTAPRQPPARQGSPGCRCATSWCWGTPRWVQQACMRQALTGVSFRRGAGERQGAGAGRRGAAAGAAAAGGRAGGQRGGQGRRAGRCALAGEPWRPQLACT